MKIIRSLSLVFAFLVPVSAMASPAVRAASCCPGDCCDDCPMCPNR